MSRVISHLLFADDTLIFCAWDREELLRLRGILLCFEAVSGLKVSLGKSELTFIGEGEDKEVLASLLGCKVVSLPINYLGLPLGSSFKDRRVWDGVVSRVEKRLSRWKRGLLSKGGRLTLIKSVLSSIPIYLMSILPLPKKVADQLERLQRNFLWGSSNEKRKFHLLEWEKVKQPLKLGGLGIRSLIPFNRALLGKWGWRFLNEKTALWREVVAAKYGLDEGGWISKVRRVSHGSGLWKAIRAEWNSVAPEIRFVVGNGENILFWEDRWIGEESLHSRFPHIYFIAKNRKARVAGVGVRSGASVIWAIELVRNLNDWELVEWSNLMSALYGWKGSLEGEDKVIWRRGKKGKFTVKEQYEVLTDLDYPQQMQRFPWKAIWRVGCPSKVFFFCLGGYMGENFDN